MDTPMTIETARFMINGRETNKCDGARQEAALHAVAARSRGFRLEKLSAGRKEIYRNRHRMPASMKILREMVRH